MKLVNYWDKYTEMHSQQNVKILSLSRFASGTQSFHSPTETRTCRYGSVLKVPSEKKRTLDDDLKTD